MRMLLQPTINYKRYDTIEEFNVDSKADYGRLNLAHVTKNKKQTSEQGGDCGEVRCAGRAELGRECRG